MRIVIRLKRAMLQLYRLDSESPDTVGRLCSMLVMYAGQRFVGNPGRSWYLPTGRVCFGPLEVYLSTGRPETVWSVIHRWRHRDSRSRSADKDVSLDWKNDNNDHKASVSIITSLSTGYHWRQVPPAGDYSSTYISCHP